ncbi:unnamed protein product, partial [Ectocarpus sp. 8 AP-2014]
GGRPRRQKHLHGGASEDRREAHRVAGGLRTPRAHVQPGGQRCIFVAQGYHDGPDAMVWWRLDPCTCSLPLILLLRGKLPTPLLLILLLQSLPKAEISRVAELHVSVDFELYPMWRLFVRGLGMQ